MRFVIITGMSGAGKSQVIRFMEDLGFYCVDNMPASLIPKFAEICFQAESKLEKVALVTDVRAVSFFQDLFSELDVLTEAGYKYEILFLEASEEVLIKRYKETRRKHPLSLEGRIGEAILAEKEMISKVREKADYIIDTSNLRPRQLMDEIVSIFVEGKKHEGLIINVISFGFKYGIPLDADLVLDVRFIPNPYYIANLKKLSGLTEEVSSYVLKWPQAKEFVEKLNQMLEFLIPNYVKEGKAQLVIAIGCTGGKHRSVTIAENIYKELIKNDHRAIIGHRDIEKDDIIK